MFCFKKPGVVRCVAAPHRHKNSGEKRRHLLAVGAGPVSCASFREQRTYTYVVVRFRCKQEAVL